MLGHKSPLCEWYLAMILYNLGAQIETCRIIFKLFSFFVMKKVQWAAHQPTPVCQNFIIEL